MADPSTLVYLVPGWWSYSNKRGYFAGWKLFTNTENFLQEILDDLIANIWSWSAPHSEYGLKGQSDQRGDNNPLLSNMIYYDTNMVTF